MKKNTSTPFVQLTQDEKANKLKEIELYLDDQNNILLVNLEFIMTNKFKYKIYLYTIKL